MLTRTNSGLATPATILGALLQVWLTPSDATFRSTDVGAPNTTLTTLINRANGQNVTNATKAQQPRLGSAVLNGYDVCWHDAAIKKFIGGTDVSIGPSATGWIVARINAGTADALYSLTAGNNTDFSTDTDCRMAGNSNAAATNVNFQIAGTNLPSVTTTANTWYTIRTEANGTNENASLYFNNGSANTSTRPSINLSVNRILIGVAGALRGANSDSAIFEWPELIVANGIPTAGQIAAMEAYLRGKYGHY